MKMIRHNDYFSNKVDFLEKLPAGISEKMDRWSLIAFIVLGAIIAIIFITGGIN